ncbi:MAG: ion channel [Bacteroidota bacterium]
MKKINLLRIGIIVVITLIFYFILLNTIVYFEKQNPDSGIQSLYDGLWWSLVTLTTVGYGDLVPTTEGGRIIGFFFLFGSLSVFAILIGQITSIMNTIAENRKLGQYGTNLKNHAVIVGWNSFGKTVTDQLIGAGKHVAVITKTKSNIDFIKENYPSSNVFVLYTDYNTIDHLHKANIEQSAIVFINLEDDTEKLVYILNLKKTFNKLKYIVSLDNADLKQTFITAGVTYALSKNEIASKLLASYIFEPDVATFNEEIIAVAEDEKLYDIKQYEVVKNNPYVGMPYEKVFFDLKRAANAVLVGIVKCQDDHRVLLKNPETDVTVEVKDYLLLLINGFAESKIEGLFQTKEGLID